MRGMLPQAAGHSTTVRPERGAVVLLLQAGALTESGGGGGGATAGSLIRARSLQCWIVALVLIVQ